MAQVNELVLKLAAWAEARKDEEGQGLVEYALIIALISIAAVGALGALGGGINGAFNNIVGNL